MILRIKFFISILIAISIFCSTTILFAASTNGTIDPNNTGAYVAAFVHSPTGQAGSERINFGKFATASANNISISAGALHGFAWSSVAGWIVMNCANTTSSCSSANQNFKVAVDGNGVLSGYAWGQQTGWINFGPFANNSTSQVKITNGNFAGTNSTAGYAWSEKYGWIVFDCSSTTTTCVNTDYGIEPVVPPSPSSGSSSGGNVSGGGFSIGRQPTTPPIVTTPQQSITPSQTIPTQQTLPGSSENSFTTFPIQPTTLPKIQGPTSGPTRIIPPSVGSISSHVSVFLRIKNKVFKIVSTIKESRYSTLVILISILIFIRFFRFF